MDLGLRGKAVLVTAASKGLGKASAVEFAREGARVAIASRSELVETAADEIRKQTGAEVVAYRADLTRAEDIRRLVDEVRERFGRIDTLVINVAGPPPGSFESLTPEDWERAVQLTLMSAVHLCYAVVPHMKANGGGTIVAIQSYTVKQPLNNLILSNSIRMAVVGMLKSMANELGPYGIRINLVMPALTLTERVQSLMAARAQANATTVEDEMNKAAQGVPLRRISTPEEFGRAVAWVASPAASFVHGTSLYVDGGLTQTPL